MTREKAQRQVLVTEDGLEYPIRSISMLDLQAAKTGLENEYRARGEPIDVPTYEVTLTGGVKVLHNLTEKNLVVAKDPAETKRRETAWAEYQAALGRMDAEYGAISRDIFLDGLDVELPSDESWIERRRRRHIEVPDDLYARLNYYKMNEILRTPGNLVRLQEEVILLSSSGGVSRSEIEAAGDSFLSSIFDRVGSKNLPERDNGKASGEEGKASELGTQSDDELGTRKPRVASKTKRSRGVSPK